MGHREESDALLLEACPMFGNFLRGEFLDRFYAPKGILCPKCGSPLVAAATYEKGELTDTPMHCMEGDCDWVEEE